MTENEFLLSQNYIIPVEGNSIVSNVAIYDLSSSLVASGYPMRTDFLEKRNAEANDLQRAVKLSKTTFATGNQAHDQCLAGIRVSFDLTFTVKAWTEAERYKFLDFVSSQSTMHRITKFDLDKQYIKYVDLQIIEIMKQKVILYNMHADTKGYPEDKLAEERLGILYSNPCGFKLTARMSTNYRCLKNIYKQRHDHRLPEWREFCKWIESLPYARELILVDEPEE